MLYPSEDCLVDSPSRTGWRDRCELNDRTKDIHAILCELVQLAIVVKSTAQLPGSLVKED